MRKVPCINADQSQMQEAPTKPQRGGGHIYYTRSPLKMQDGHELKPDTVKWFETMAPFLLLAYQAGAEDLPLTESFPLLEPTY